MCICERSSAILGIPTDPARAHAAMFTERSMFFGGINAAGTDTTEGGHVEVVGTGDGRRGGRIARA